MDLWKVSGSGTSCLKAEPDAWEEDNRSLKSKHNWGLERGVSSEYDYWSYRGPKFEDSRLMPSTHIRWLTNICNSSSLFGALFWPLLVPSGICTHRFMQIHTHTHKLKYIYINFLIYICKTKLIRVEKRSLGYC